MAKIDDCLKRWYPLIDNQVQLDLINAISKGIRFPVVAAGRRSGKSERFKRFITKYALSNPSSKLFIAAPTYNQVKRIYWDDIKLLSMSTIYPHKPSETDLIIYLPNQSEIHLVGLDKPERIEGVAWDGGGIDEFADLS